MAKLTISNRDARWLWLSSCGLARPPTGALDVMQIIRDLGFVQIDSIRNVTRAHHHIIWSRNQNYRESMLWPELGQRRNLFEHFTHDASLIPVEFYPMWQRQFARLGEHVARKSWYQSGLAKDTVADILKRIEKEGPLSTHAFQSDKPDKSQMWARPAHKKALDQLWYAGRLGTSHRKNFVKYYDLAEKIFPKALREHEVSQAKQINWLCQSALERLSFGSMGEVQRFWDATTAKETRQWGADIPGAWEEISVVQHDGSARNILGTPDIENRLAKLSPPTSRLRLLNPFDPAIRDRTRLQSLFGFEYRNEIFVPKAKRKWGYYVYPLLEGDRFVGRIELKADRAKGTMRVENFWPEPGVNWPAKRFEKLERELHRFAKLAGVETLDLAALSQD